MNNEERGDISSRGYEQTIPNNHQPPPNVGALSSEPGNCEKEYKRPRLELLREYPIRISFASLGCMIEVGCKAVAFSTISEAMEALIDYVANPYEEQKKWNEKFNKENQ